MKYDYYFGFDSFRLKTTFSYVVKAHLTELAKTLNKTYTFDIEDDFDVAIIGSGNDYFNLLSRLNKKECQKAIVAYDDIDDIITEIHKKGIFEFLSPDALSYYNVVDHLCVYFPSQKEYLESKKIKNKFVRLPITNPYGDFSCLSEVEKKAFLSYYQIQPGKELIVSYGSLSDKETVVTMEGIAQNFPEKEFIFFGKGDRDALTKKLLERVTMPKNIRFINNLPEELYRSFLYNTNRLLLVGDYLSYPEIIFDCINHDIPIISYSQKGFTEILNDENVSLCKDFASLFKVINSDIDQEKVKKAKQTIQAMMANNILEYMN